MSQGPLIRPEGAHWVPFMSCLEKGLHVWIGEGSYPSSLMLNDVRDIIKMLQEVNGHCLQSFFGVFPWPHSSSFLVYCTNFWLRASRTSLVLILTQANLNYVARGDLHLMILQQCCHINIGTTALEQRGHRVLVIIQRSFSLLRPDGSDKLFCMSRDDWNNGPQSR